MRRAKSGFPAAWAGGTQPIFNVSWDFWIFGDDEKCKFERNFRVTDVNTSEVYRRVREASEDPLLRAGGRLLLCVQQLCTGCRESDIA